MLVNLQKRTYSLSRLYQNISSGPNRVLDKRIKLTQIPFHSFSQRKKNYDLDTAFDDFETQYQEPNRIFKQDNEEKTEPNFERVVPFLKEDKELKDNHFLSKFICGNKPKPVFNPVNSLC